MSFLDNKKLLIFGPANKFDEKTDLSYFNNYDIIFINNKMIELLKPNLKKIKKKKFHIILMVNGVFTNGNPETIKKFDRKVSLYLVTQTNLIPKLIDIGILREKCISLSFDYEKYNFKGHPNIIPKLLMLFIENNVKYDLLNITGVTFYMEKTDKDKVLAYHPNYHNWETKLPKDKLNLSNDEKLLYHVSNRSQEPTHKWDHGVKENWNFFINYYNKNKEKIKVDNVLEQIIKENS